MKELPLERKREAGLLRLLDHPFLPQMIDYTEQNGHCYLVMEYIRGKSLRKYLDEGREFSQEEILGIGRIILDILEYLHSRKPAIYYGDLKPDNLMMTEEHSIYLVDFGSAVLGYERQTFTCLGTEGYAAPEQYRGKIGPSSDIFALGKTLDELCKKRRIRCFLQYPGLIFFIWKCCRRQPEKRWKSGAEALAFLKKLRPLSLKLWKGLILALGLFLAAALGAGVLMEEKTQDNAKLPPFEAAFSPVVSRYLSMGFRSGGSGVRETVLLQVEDSARRLLCYYREPDQQKRLLTFLAGNSELQGNQAKAEGYYRQLIKMKGAEAGEYASYGMFLLRQERNAESRELYELYCTRAEILGERGDASSRNMTEWKKYL